MTVTEPPLAPAKRNNLFLRRAFAPSCLLSKPAAEESGRQAKAFDRVQGAGNLAYEEIGFPGIAEIRKLRRLRTGRGGD
jgi:hypothetical protein